MSEEPKTTNILIAGKKYKAYYKLEDLKSDNIIEDESFITSFQHTEDGKRYFILFENYQQFTILIHKILPPLFVSYLSDAIESYNDFFTLYPEFYEKYKNIHLSLNFNEVITSEEIRMFFDIDCDDVNLDKNLLLSEVLDGVLKYLSEKESIEYPKSRIMVITGHKSNKISYHLIFPDLVVEDMKTMKEICCEIVNNLSEEYRDFVDQSYGKNKNFRMLFQTKRGSKNFLKFQKKWIYIDQEDEYHSIEYKTEEKTDHERLYFTMIFEDSFVRNFKNYKYFIQSKDEEKRESYIEHHNIPDLTPEQWNQVIQLIPNGLKLDGNTNGKGFIPLSNQGGFDCMCCSKHKGENVRHDNDNAFLSINQYGVYFKCHRATKNVRAIQLLFLNNNISNESDFSKKKQYGYLHEPNFTHIYDEKYCLPIKMNEHSIYFLSAGLGKGKTKVIVDFVKDKLIENPQTKVLILSPRQIFASSLLNRINQDQLDFQCYLNLKPKDYNAQKRLIVQMESLQHISSNYDIIIIDEIESCLAQFESAETMKFNLKNCADTFERLIKNSTYVIGCDAFLSTKSIKVLSKISNKKMILCKNKSPLVKRRAEEYDTISSLIESLINDLKLNKKIFFVSASKDKIENIEKLIIKHLPDKKYKIYHSLSKEKITNVNQDWKDVDLILVSPSVTVGINYDLEDFDLLYLYGSPNSCCVRDIFQSSMRVRHIKENKMKFCICKNFQSKNKDESIYSLHNIREKLLMDKSLYKEFYNSVIPGDKDNLLNWKDMCSWLFLNKLYTIKERNQSRSFYKKVFYYYLGLCNYDYDMDEQIRLEVKHNLYEFEKVVDYHKIPAISNQEEVKEVMEKFKSEKDGELLLRLFKFNFDNTVDLDKILPEHINQLFKEYINPIMRKKFYNIKKEKYKYDYIDRTDFLRNVFWENSNKSAMRTFKIKELNSILGIRNSCEAVDLDLEQTQKVIEKIIPMYDDLCAIFNIKEQKLKDDSEPDEQSRKKVKYILQQVYQKWNGSNIKNKRNRIMVNGNRTYKYIFSKQICGIIREGKEIPLTLIIK
jgi:hypothetical protein